MIAKPRIAPASLVRPALRELPEYNYVPAAGKYKLDQNEVPWELPRWVKREVARRLAETDWARYPDFHADALRREIGRLHGWPAEGVLVGNGSNEILALALEALTAVRGEVLGVEPCFGLYRMFVTRAGAQPRFLPPRPDLRLPLGELRAEVEADPHRPLLLASPNNPTGEALSPREVEDLLEHLEAPLFLDNAYGEFCRHDYRPLLARHPHLLLFRTFSKAWSLAGLRLGYLLADPDLVRELIKVKDSYNCDVLSLAAATAAVEDQGYYADLRAKIVATRGRMAVALTELGFRVTPSQANFVWCHRIDVPVKPIYEELKRRKILVRYMNYDGYDGLRISVGSDAEIDKLLSELRTIA